MAFPYDFPLNSGVPAMIEYIADHAQQAKDRLAEEYKNQPNLAALLDAFNRQTQALEDAFWALFTERGVSAAYGAQLDVLGKIVGQARNGLADEDFRLWIIAKIKLNNSSGTPEEIYDILNLVKPDAVDLEIRDEPPAAFTVKMHGPGVPDNVLVFVRAARAAGVRVIVEWASSPTASLFKFDTPGQGFDSGLFAAASL